MIRGLYIAATSMLGNEKLLDTIGNNVANIDSTGFKRDELQQEAFKDILISKYNGSPYTTDQPFTGVKVVQDKESFYNLTTDGGYFRVNTEEGVSYNKALRLSVDKDGYLSTFYLNSDRKVDANLGDRVMGLKGEINVGDQAFTITDKGEVQVGGQTVDTLVYQPTSSVIGTMGSGIKKTRLVTDFSQGNLVPTGGSLDTALRGDGYYELSTPYGTMYSRNGVFVLNEKNELVTPDGFYVQGFKGNIVLAGDNVSINEFGEIIQNGQVVDKLKTTNFTNKGDLRKIGGSLFAYSEKPQGQQVAFEGKVVQGAVEQSNVNAITEMIRMISVQREYENGNKLVRTIDETLQKAATELGTVR